MQRSPGIKPLRVRVTIERPRAAPKIYVDSQLVSNEELGALLQKAVGLRPPDWPVYVEGDRDLEWQAVAKVIDMIHGRRAEVVLLTAPVVSSR